MSESKFNPSTLILLVMIVFVSIIRIAAPFSDQFKEVANFSAVGAMALFGGAYFNTHLKAFGFPLLILVLSDLFLGLTIYREFGLFYPGWYWTYIAFALMVLVARAILSSVTVARLLGATLSIVLIHWIVTDFAVWMGGTMYPQTLEGFWLCLVAAIPFELKFLYGTLIYGTVMFGAFELLKSKYPYLKTVRSVA